MTSFGWKRKIGAAETSAAEKAFNPEEQEAETGEPDFDWVAEAKKRKVPALEDAPARVERLKREGAALAEEGRCWQALERWGEAGDAALWEMKAQVVGRVGLAGGGPWVGWV